MQGGHGGQVQGVPGGGLKGADAPLAQDHVLVAPGHDILSTHQQLLQGVGQAPLEEDGLAGVTQLLQQFKVLHVPGAHLDHVHVLEQGQVVGVHDLGNDGQAGGPLGLQQQLDAVGLQALEGVGGGAGLERAAPEHGGSGGLHALSHRDDLLLALHGTGAGDHGEVAPAHQALVRAHLNDGVLGVKLAVGIFIGLRHPLHILHDIQSTDEVAVQLAGVADDADDGGVVAGGQVGAQVLTLDPVDQVVYPLFFCFRLDNDDHNARPFLLSDAALPPGHEKRTRGEVFLTAGPVTSFDSLRKGGHAIVCSKKHFYFVGPKAVKVKVAKKESGKQIQHDGSPFRRSQKFCGYHSTGTLLCQ